MDYKTGLKPCPFCGGEAFLDEVLDRIFVNAHHTKDCLITPSTWLGGEHDLSAEVRAWNRRYEEGGNTNGKRRR